MITFAIAVVIALTFVILGLFVIPFGALLQLAMFAFVGWVFGLIAYILLPFLAAPLPESKRLGLGRWYVRQGLLTLWRPVLAIGDHAPTLKRVSIDDDINAGYISLGGRKRILKSLTCKHRWGAFSFGVVDSDSGSYWDPRQQDVTNHLATASEDGRMAVRDVIKHSGGSVSVQHYIRTFFELPRNTVRRLSMQISPEQGVDGSEPADIIERVYEFFRVSQSESTEKMPLTRLMLPIIAFGAGFGLVLLAKQAGLIGDGGGGGGATTVISQGLGPAMVLSIPFLGDGGDDGDGLLFAAGFAVAYLLAALTPTILIWQLYGMLPAVFAVIGTGMGATLLPFIAYVDGKMLPAGMAETLADVYVVLGFAAFERPELHLDERDRYQLRERPAYSAASTVRFARSELSWAYENSQAAWGDLAATADIVADEYVPVQRADGGPDLPDGYAVGDSIQRGQHHGYVPTDPDPDTLYIRSGRALARVRGLDGQVLQDSYSAAKEKFNPRNLGVDEMTLVKLSLPLAPLGAFLGWLVVG